MDVLAEVGDRCQSSSYPMVGGMGGCMSREGESMRRVGGIIANNGP